jgi:SAM-dependent methyltransferase
MSSAPTEVRMDTERLLQRATDLVLRWDRDGALTLKRFAAPDELVLRDGASLAFELLQRLHAPRSPASVVQELASEHRVAEPELRALLDGLVQRGLLEEPGSVDRDRYGALYAGLDIHRAMVLDHPRTSAFRDGIRAAVQPGDVVLDVGCGTGVLSCFAARAGARHVYAVERAEIIELARQVVARNRLGDRVTLIRGDVESVALPEPVDLIVSEWLGHFAVIENMLDSVLVARDRWLRPGGRLLPGAVELWIAPMADRFLVGSLVDCWTRDLYGLDFTPLQQAALGQSAARSVGAQSLLAQPQVVHRIDVAASAAGSMRFAGAATFMATHAARLDGVACHFTAELAPGVTLDTGPHAPSTHWLQHVLPLPPVEVQRGDAIRLELGSRPSDFSRRPEIALDGEIRRQGQTVARLGPRVYL